MQTCANVIFDFLQSKCLVSAERALRTELELMYQRNVTNDGSLISRNLWQSRLEGMLDAPVPRGADAEEERDRSDSPQMGVLLSQIGSLPLPGSGTPTRWSPCLNKQGDSVAGGS